MKRAANDGPILAPEVKRSIISGKRTSSTTSYHQLLLILCTAFRQTEFLWSLRALPCLHVTPLDDRRCPDDRIKYYYGMVPGFSTLHFIIPISEVSASVHYRKVRIIKKSVHRGFRTLLSTSSTSQHSLDAALPATTTTGRLRS